MKRRLIAATKLALLTLALVPATSSMVSEPAEAQKITVCFGGENACPVENEEKKTGIIIIEPN